MQNTDKLLDICLVERAEEVALASAPLGTVGVGDLVKIKGSGNDVFRVVHMLSYSVEEGDNDYRFLSSAHGADICDIERVYRSMWEKEEAPDVQ